MYEKLALSFAVSALIVAVGGFFAVLGRLDDIEKRLPREAAGRPPGVVPAEPAPPVEPGSGGEEDPLESRDPLVKLDYLIEALSLLDDHMYEYYIDLGKDLYDLRRDVRQLRATVKQVVQGLNLGPTGFARIGWGLSPKGTPISAEIAKVYKEEAAEFGIQVEDGVVHVRGFLNFSPNVEMPIEYFITRFPLAAHETLVHLIGNRELDQLAENPYAELKGLATALYKGLMAAGFRPGEPTHPDPTSDPKHPRWILPTGDTVYIAVKYERDGKEHIALATDWVMDPVEGKVLPVDSFRFTGSARGEDPDTGDEILGSEMMGLLVSVWPNAAAMAEVALESALRNDYTYNFARIPKPEGDEPLYLDVIFSKTPIEPKGEGAAPIDRPTPVGDGASEAGPR